MRASLHRRSVPTKGLSRSQWAYDTACLHGGRLGEAAAAWARVPDELEGEAAIKAAVDAYADLHQGARHPHYRPRVRALIVNALDAFEAARRACRCHLEAGGAA